MNNRSFLAIGLPNRSQRDTVHLELLGNYVRFMKDEWLCQYETIRIEAVNAQENQYRVVYSSSWQQKFEGGHTPWQSEKTEWLALYDPARHLLIGKGRLIVLDRDKKILYLGKGLYKKIK